MYASTSKTMPMPCCACCSLCLLSLIPLQRLCCSCLCLCCAVLCCVWVGVLYAPAGHLCLPCAEAEPKTVEETHTCARRRRSACNTFVTRNYPTTETRLQYLTLTRKLGTQLAGVSKPGLAQQVGTYFPSLFELKKD